METLQEIGFHTISLMYSTYPSTIWGKSSTSFAHTLVQDSMSDHPGGRGCPPNLSLPQILFFCYFKPHAKFQNPTITPSVRKVSEAERKKEEITRKNTVNSGDLVLWQRTQTARTNSKCFVAAAANPSTSSTSGERPQLYTACTTGVLSKLNLN